MGTEAMRFLIVWMAGWINSRQLEVIDFLREENRVLREQLAGRRLRFTDDQRRRLAAKGKIVGRRRLQEFTGLVTPETILRWHRELVARTYDGSARRGTGRPATHEDVQQLVVRMATENPTWGYTRLVGALSNLGQRVGRNTVKRVLRRHGFESAPVRGQTHAVEDRAPHALGAVAATDFFSVEVLTLTGLVRYFVLFVIDLQTRRVQADRRRGAAAVPRRWWATTCSEAIRRGRGGDRGRGTTRSTSRRRAWRRGGRRARARARCGRR